tara:strand:- start:92 stop:379 length:288 start_codon:yes stop_codon:yes gene_type:complete
MKNHELIERLRFREAWLKDFLIYKQHKDITNKVSDQIYSKIPIVSLLLRIYFLPTIIMNFLIRLRESHDYAKCMMEIQILKEEIKKNEKNRIDAR